MYPWRYVTFSYVVHIYLFHLQNSLALVIYPGGSSPVEETLNILEYHNQPFRVLLLYDLNNSTSLKMDIYLFVSSCLKYIRHL